MTGIIEFKPKPYDRVEAVYDGRTIGSIMPEIPGFPAVVWNFDADGIHIPFRHAVNERRARAEILRVALDWLYARGLKADAAILSQQGSAA